MDNLESSLKRILGDTYPLAKHFAQITLLFVGLLICLFIVRNTIPLLFSPGDTLTKVLQIVDAYAALLGLVGYVIWITLDMIAVLIARAKVFGRPFRKDDEGSV